MGCNIIRAVIMCMKKTFTLSLALAICASLHAEDFKLVTFGLGVPGLDEPQLQGLGISPDGSYVCGSVEYGEGIFVAETATGEITWKIVDGSEGGELRHVTNEGIAIGFTDQGVLYSFDTGKETFIEAPEGYREILGEALTNDGKMLVGSLVGAYTEAAYSKDGGDWTLLPVPSKEELGALAPRSLGSAAKLVSGDGKVIFGFLGSFAIPIAWIMNDAGEYEYDFFPAKYFKTDEDSDDPEKILTGLSAMYLNMSNNGKYLSMVAKIDDEETGGFMNVPVIYDTDKRELKIYKETQNIDPAKIGMYPIAIADDGTFIGTIGQPVFGSIGSFIMEAGASQARTYAEAFPKFYDEIGESDDLGFNIPTSISADGRYILGYTYYCDDYMNDAAFSYYETYIIERDIDSSVDEISDNASGSGVVEAIYSLDGQRLREVSKGINIIRMSDGSVRKVLKR